MAGEELIGQRIGHLRVDALLGQGGMGEVYDAFDERLQRRVALKAMRGPHRWDRAARGRFLREARILSRLEHPGICRIYDLVEWEDCDFLVLERIEGQTLGTLAGEGQLDAKRRLEIAESIARVLAVAHTAQVAHRDLKPDNVMLTKDGQVKLLDFGVSRSLAPGERVGDGEGPTPAVSAPTGPPRADVTLAEPPALDSGASTLELTEIGALVGTVRYMSPEQAHGLPVDTSTDLYSLGILLHELLTGRSPYPEGLSWNQLLLAVQQGRTTAVVGLPPELCDVIERLKSVDPSERPSAAEVADRIRHVREAPARARRRRLVLALVAAAAVALLAAVGVTWRLAAAGREPIRPEGRVAVLPFENRTALASQDWVSTGLRELVLQRLGGRTEADLVPIRQVTDAIKALALPPGGSPGEAQEVALRKALGADVVVRVAVEREKEDYRLRYAIASPRRRVERAVRAGTLSLAGDRLAGALAGDLGLGSVETGTGDPFARQCYGIGVHVLETRGAREARPFFEAVLVLEPGLGWARLHLAECQEQLGDWKGALEAGRTLLAEAEQRSDDALTSSVLMFLGGIETARSEYAEAEAFLRRALEVGRKQGSRSGEATALFHLAKLEYTRGRYEQAQARFEQALGLQRETRNTPDEIDTLNYLGLVALNRGELERAGTLFNEVQARAEEVGNRRRRAHALVNLGNIAEKKRDLAAAERLWNEALVALRDAGDARNEIIVLNNLGVLALRRRQLPEAQTLFRALGERAAGLGDKVMEAAAWLNLAQAYLYADTPAQARECIERVMAADTWVRGHAETFAVRANLAFQEGRLAEAVTLMAESKRLSTEAWTPDAQAELDLYQRSVRAGRRLPAPVPTPATD